MYTTNKGIPSHPHTTWALRSATTVVVLCSLNAPSSAMHGSNRDPRLQVTFKGTQTDSGLATTRRPPAQRFFAIAQQALSVASESRDSFLGTQKAKPTGPTRSEALIVDHLLTQSLEAARKCIGETTTSQSETRVPVGSASRSHRETRETIEGNRGTKALRRTWPSGDGKKEVRVTHDLPRGLCTVVTFEDLSLEDISPGPDRHQVQTPPSETLMIPKRLLRQAPGGALDMANLETSVNRSLLYEVDWVEVKTPISSVAGAETSLSALIQGRTVEMAVRHPIWGPQTYVFGVIPPSTSTD